MILEVSYHELEDDLRTSKEFLWYCYERFRFTSGGHGNLVMMWRDYYDSLRAVDKDVIASLKEFVALYDGTHDLLGPSVKAKLARAVAAIQKAEGGAA